jgi:hypothetical protein
VYDIAQQPLVQVLVPHLPSQMRRAPGHRYDDPLRLPRAHLGVVRFSCLVSLFAKAPVRG